MSGNNKQDLQKLLEDAEGEFEFDVSDTDTMPLVPLSNQEKIKKMIELSSHICKRVHPLRSQLLDLQEANESDDVLTRRFGTILDNSPLAAAILRQFAKFSFLTKEQMAIEGIHNEYKPTKDDTGHIIDDWAIQIANGVCPSQPQLPPPPGQSGACAIIAGPSVSNRPTPEIDPPLTEAALELLFTPWDSLPQEPPVKIAKTSKVILRKKL